MNIPLGWDIVGGVRCGALDGGGWCSEGAVVVVVVVLWLVVTVLWLVVAWYSSKLYKTKEKSNILLFSMLCDGNGWVRTLMV